MNNSEVDSGGIFPTKIVLYDTWYAMYSTKVTKRPNGDDQRDGSISFLLIVPPITELMKTYNANSLFGMRHCDELVTYD